MINKLYIRTFGCQMNEYDSNKMVDILKHSHDLTLTDDATSADVLLLNTCSIREKAQDKLFHQLGRWSKLKNKNPNLIIGVGGCVASQEGELILKRTPYVDIIFGPQTLHRLPNMLNDALNNKKTSIDISFPEIEKFDHLPKPRTNSVTAFVSIMEGCSKYCTFCIVPYTRGEEISRPFNDVINEVKILASQGVREINLLGQNVNAYQGSMNDGEVSDLALLINIVAKISGIKRIRYTTSHPNQFSDSLIEAYAEVPELVSHLHLPVQSGSDKILRLMKRGYMSIEYKSKIRKLRKIRPDISISSDFIIGFPGENEKDFLDTMILIDEIGFDKSFSFIYSVRPGTPAASYPDDIDIQVKKQRLALIQKTINNNTEHISQLMIGSIQKVLVENITKKGNELFGRTENMRNTHFKGDKSLIGQIVNVKITKGRGNSLMGDLLTQI
ncbi:tRNA (N6-isopentenyl adenosine(37)-C2)-methylthiotransferase MiaB [Candidatus Vesicomyidisocius calyptogenae]|uniref:tRNA-2-methylthio-N(6)-dimethylallyladenosine synthase n=1 Tax=Vesicomyosocius okutanii subsp. Calyptogena okutanii (strain HA) TaxID=412965 RepID=MIAB_VESOH|nr:tRNA (N6-isopentenyl adenosine(37)-C2)-methylthiotransferase MiaB [Candidatus Vesicomyosocius okutanii]A5CW77.1 RecName: Full=tRNA-2-methylthio-N(6)-dimethylallyladenosine synthase; AltName: Full=(Dimethylallyl)adenosine tRNA methylthiotransferase MiaB; AltName: Full=tRNA-i(6)A37 methylthiotransferase [Candidatus Vesicomyosocius okutanii]BAF61800.1 tRNA-thiotransferase [Candidatus Vesicomyosocius okutanii]